MKTLVSFLLGAVSSALLSVGFVRAATACDPHLRHSSIASASHAGVTDSCTTACYFIQSDSNGSNQA